MKPIQISDFKKGRSIHGFYVCAEKQLRHARNGDLFLDMIFSDSTGIISGKLWGMVDQFQEKFHNGDAVAVKGNITEYNNQLQLTVLHINKATNKQYAKYGFSNDLLFKAVSEPIEKLWKRLERFMHELNDPHGQLIRIIFKKYEEKIKIIPAFIGDHYSIRGGFLKHIVTVAEMAMKILPHYPQLDKNLVLSGILIHDIGKVESFNDALKVDYTDAGKLVGPMVLGLEILRKFAALVNNFPEELLLRLEHIVLLNENIKILDSLDKAKFPEVVFIKCVYSMNFQMDVIFESINKESISK